MGPHLRPGRLLRFSLLEGGFTFDPATGRPTGADLSFQGAANQRRGRADIFSKVLFQAQARRLPLPYTALQMAAAGVGPASAGCLLPALAGCQGLPGAAGPDAVGMEGIM